MDHLTRIRTESDTFLAAALDGSTDVDVPTCPGWTMTDLLGHLGQVQHFHGGHLTRGVTDPPPGPRPTPPATGLADWFRAGTAQLIANLEGLPVDAPAWTFQPGNHTLAFWRRRMVHEASIHRWDAQHARGAVTGFDVEVAEDGIDEYLTVFLPRSRPDDAPHGTVTLRTTEGRTHRVAHPADGPGDRVATISGPAEQVYLAVWGRVPLQELDLDGDLELARSIVNR